MANVWFRSWHGAPTNPKWPMIANRAGTVPGVVAATWWALMDYASQNKGARGSIAGFDPEEWAGFSGFDVDTVEKIVTALRDKEFILEDGTLAGWSEHQPKREDDSTERVRKSREKKRDVTQCNAEGDDGNALRGEERQSADVKELPPLSSMTREHAINAIIVAANRGMHQNPRIHEPANPIPTGHGSRQDVHDWLADGMPADWVAQVVEEKARKYVPDRQGKPISSMKYFDGVVRQEWQKKLTQEQTNGTGGAAQRTGSARRGGDPEGSSEAARAKEERRRQLAALVEDASEGGHAAA